MDYGGALIVFVWLVYHIVLKTGRDNYGVAHFLNPGTSGWIPVTFLPEEMIQLVNVSTTDDIIHERDEQFTAVLEAGDVGVRLGNDTATATVLDDDGNV